MHLVYAPTVVFDMWILSRRQDSWSRDDRVDVGTHTDHSGHAIDHSGQDAMLDPLDDLESLYRRHLPMVYRYTTARLGTSRGEELASEVFHAAALAFRDGRGEHVTPAWLMATARNRVIDEWRQCVRTGGRSGRRGRGDEYG